MKIKSRQSLIDIALQAGGCVEAAVDIAAANDMDVWDEPGGELVIPPNLDIKAEEVEYYSANGVEPATELRGRELEPASGIGGMAIDYNFIVSENNFESKNKGLWQEV